MNDKPENPPAFPTTMPLNGWGDPNQGMSLRDYYAGQCLAGFMSQQDTPLRPDDTIEDVRATACASWYAWADAMLAARGQQ